MNASPEPFSNILVSLAENGLLVGGVWLTLAHPLAALGVGLAAAGALVVWLGGRAARALRRLRDRLASRFPAGRSAG